MGVTLPPDLRIAGYRPALFKQALLAFRRTRSPTRFVELRGIFGNSRDGAIVFEECIDRGLIVEVDGGYDLSPAGEAIAGGKARSRTWLSDAAKVIDQMLERAQVLNADPDGVRFINQIWLFGSTMRQEETVGDIDMAVVSSRRPRFEGNWTVLTEHVDRLLDARSDAPQTRYFPWSGEDWLTERARFGPRRHHLLAGVQSGTSDLELLGVPCRLIFDRGRGGRVDDDIVARTLSRTGAARRLMRREPCRT